MSYNYPWPDLKFWNSGEYQVVREKLDDLRKQSRDICPDRKDLFNALRSIRCEDTRVVLLGQDPYPNKTLATGYAFSVPANITNLPPTLQNILKEYHDDLGHPVPVSGDISVWAQRGVLLWNAIPSCTAGKSLSHDWTEWMYLTKEILERVSAQGAVFALMGSKAQRYRQYIYEDTSKVILTSHPSPLALKGGRVPRNPFLGSRLFSTINAELCALGKEAVNWKL